MEPHEFAGTIAPYHWDSVPHWPEPPRPPEGAPNIVIVVLDDVGFAQVGCFGSDIATPHLDGLAGRGLRYTNFHTTALCSPTRACVLTGRNHHSAGMGRIIELATGFPGYDSRIPRSVGFLPEMLTPHGYAAYAVGKWHLTPEDETHLGASRERWPLARGFERFYGFFSGETHQNAPALVYDSHQINPPRSPDEGYHLTEDLVDHAIEFLVDLRHVDPGKPFLLYLATGACHSPHQAPRQWIDRYRGAFDGGWDRWRERTLGRQIEMGLLPEGTRLSPRPEWVPAWDSLSDRERAVYARYMEAFAGFLSHTDHHLGRLFEHLERSGEIDNTLVVVLSDNGASSEGGPVGSLNDVRIWNGVAQSVDEAWERLDEIGGPRIHNNYPWGWTVAGNTPFRRWKREVHEGGVADPLIVHWPARVPPGSPAPAADGEGAGWEGEGGDGGGGRGTDGQGTSGSAPATGGSAGRRSGLRHQYVHAIDLVPTILDAIGIDPPAEIRGVTQRAVEGVSFLDTLDDPGAADRHVTQYYEMFGCRAIYHDGWKAVVYHPIQAERPGLDRAGWELYDLRVDPTECDDRAADEPELLQAMIERWWVEAARHQVLPLDNRPFSELVFDRPSGIRPRQRYVYHPHAAMTPEAVAVNVRNRPHVVRATIEVPEGGARGVIMSQGSVLGGWALYLGDDGAPCHVHNLSGKEQYRVVSPAPVPAGTHRVELRYGHVPGEPKVAQILLDGEVVAAGEIPKVSWNRFSLTGAGLCCGWSAAPAVADDLVAPARFTGGLEPVVVEVDGDPVIDAEAEANDAIVSQ